MEDIRWNAIKSFDRLAKEFGRSCTVPGCGLPLTNLMGPGSSKYCAKHQKNMAVYGGMAKEGRVYTQHKKRACSKCGFDPFDDDTAKKYDYFQYKESDPDLFNRCARAMLVGDHSGELRKVDGNTEHEEDITTLCQMCNAVKTQIHKDYLKERVVK